MARHPVTVTIFAVAIAVALVSAVANSQTLPPAVIVSIQNNFAIYNLTVQCRSNDPARVQPHVLLPKEVYTFHSHPDVEHHWKCDLSTARLGNLCRGHFQGEFLMWQDNELPARLPRLCSTKCAWLVDASGLSLIQQPGGKRLHIYEWPIHIC